MFGFRTVVSPSFTQRLPQQGLYARIIKKSFGSLEKCTEKDIQAVVGQCQAMSSSLVALNQYMLLQLKMVFI